MAGSWSAESLAIGRLARKLGLLDGPAWKELRDAGPPDDAEERAETDQAIGGTLMRVLIERELIEMDDADRLLAEIESGGLDEFIEDGEGEDDRERGNDNPEADDDRSISDDLSAIDEEDEDEGDGLADNGSMPEVPAEARLESDEFRVPEVRDDSDDVPPAARPASQTQGWLAGLAETGSDNRQQTSRVSTVSGSARLQIRPPSGRQASADAAAASKATEPIRPTSGIRDPFTGSSTIGPYVLAEQLDRQGFSATFRARHTQTGEFGVLKVFVGKATDAAVARFLEDARTAAAIHHPQIATIQEYGSDGERHYVATDTIEGMPVDDLKPPPGPRVAAQLLREVARAVHVGHGTGRVHGRLRPACIIVDATGTPHLTGYVFPGGRAGDKEDADPPFHPYMLYASPELVVKDRSRVDARSDVFSLGALLYRLLAHRAPFETTVPAEYRRHVTGEDPPPPRSIRPEVPPPLELICLKAMSRDPDRRYPTAADMAEDLERFLAGREVTARPAGMTQRMPAIGTSESKRLRGRLLAAGLTAVAVLAATLIIWRANSGADPGRGGGNSTNIRNIGSGGMTDAEREALRLAEARKRRQQARDALGDPSSAIESETRREHLEALIPDIERANGIDPSWSRPDFLLGRIHDRLGNAAAAVTYYQSSIRREPRLPEADYRAAMRLAFSTEPATAADAMKLHVDALLAVGEGHPRLHAMQIVASATAEWLADADADVVPRLERARELAPDLADPWFVQGYVLGRVHPAGERLFDRRGPVNSGVRIYDARQALEEGLFAEPLAVEAHAVVGVHELATGRPRAAEEELRAALAVRPQWADVEYYLARALFSDGRLDEAITGMTALLDRVADIAEYWRFRGTLHIHAGNWAAADADLTQAFEIDLDPTIQFLRGLVRSQIPEQLENAARDFRSVTGDPRSRFKRDQDDLRTLEDSELASLLTATRMAHDYFAARPAAKAAIRQLESSQSSLGRLVSNVRKERAWTPAMEELLILLYDTRERRDGFRAGLRRVREEYGQSTTGIYYELDEWLAPARLQRMLRDEEVMMQRTLVRSRDLYVRACVYYRRGLRIELARRDIEEALRIENHATPGSNPFGQFDRARLEFALSAILLALNDRDEQRYGHHLQRASRLDPVLTRFWREDPDYDRIHRD